MICYDPAGHGSMTTTYDNVQQKKRITYVDVRQWFDTLST